MAERSIEELGRELLHIAPEGGAVSSLSLALATANLNMRIRHSGLSAREVWTQRDQITGEQLPINDRELILAQNAARLKNHTPSAQSKAHGKGPSFAPRKTFQVGDLVYLTTDRDKNKARDRYIVTESSNSVCSVRKFTQSQYRTRSYTVNCSDLYHVLPTMLPALPGPDRATTETESSSEASSDDTSDTEVDDMLPSVPTNNPPQDPIAAFPQPVQEAIIQPLEHPVTLPVSPDANMLVTSCPEQTGSS